MKFAVFKLCVTALLLDSLVGAETSCEDIDHDSCIAMSKQNPTMCQDTVLGISVCPRVCHNCPLVCYSCITPSYDITACNTITCSQNQDCDDKRGVHSTDCCNVDLCNIPKQTTSETPPVMTVSHVVQQSYPVCARDLIVFLDLSKSIRQNWTEVEQFLTDIVKTMDIGPNENQTKLSMSLFGNAAYTMWYFDRNNFNISELLLGIDIVFHQSTSIVPSGDLDQTFIDLKYNTELSDTKLGNRPSVPDVPIFITGSNSGRSLDLMADLRRRYSTMIAIGIGNITDKDSVSDIATDSNHAIFLDTATELLNPAMENRVLNLICGIS